MAVDRSTCPSPGTLEQLLAERLSAEERDLVETHVEVCTVCQTHLEAALAPKSVAVASDEAKANLDVEPAEDFLSRLRQLTPPAGKGERSHEAQTKGPKSGRSNTALAVGDRLGQYEILGELGRGGMGAVFKARHSELGKMVALKVLKAEQLSEVAIARFKNEIRAVGRLDHPNIVVAHDAGESRGIHFLVMEFVDGMNLARLVERHGRLNAADACEAIRQAAVGLQHAYEKGLVHRDVKPSNLMLARDGRVRLLDLGLARSFEATADTLTTHGMVLGTADYVAPEQWDNPHAADTRSDIYSLGCSLYQLLVGKAPFASASYKTVYSKMRGHMEEPPPIERIGSETTPELAAILSRMMAKDPKDRYATPADVAAALRPFTNGSDLGLLLKVAESESPSAPRTAMDVSTPSPGKWDTDTVRKGQASKSVRRFAIPIALAFGCLFVIWAVFFGPRIWYAAQVAAKAPLTIEDFQVKHSRTKAGTPLGDLRNTNEKINTSDNVQICAKFSAPAYSYLIALNPDGTQQLCHPVWEGDKPEVARAARPKASNEVRFFPNDKDMFGLDIPGLQVFVLIASSKPLPSYAEWQSNAGKLPWKAVGNGGEWRWEFNGKEFVRLPLERGSRIERESEPEILKKLCEFLKSRPEIELVRVIAFPVTEDDQVKQLNSKAWDLCREGKFIEAQDPLRKVVALTAEKKGDNHSATIDARRSLKNIEEVSAKSEELRSLFKESYHVRDEMTPFVKKGRYREALPLAKRVMEMRQQVFGPDHEIAAVAAFEYAQILHNDSQYTVADPIFKECLKTIRRVAGENHAATAKAHGSLAINLDAQDKYAESQPHYDAALRISLAVNGDDHSDTGIEYSNMATHLERQARYAQAEPYYRKSIDILARLEGEAGPHVIIGRNNLALNLSNQGRFAEADAVQRQALEAQRKLLGDDHPDIAMSYSNYAVNLDEQGRHVEAEPLIQKSVEINRIAHGENNSKTAISINNLAMNFQHQARYEEAEPLFRKALEIHLQANGGEPNRSVSVVLNNLSANLRYQGKYKEAQERIEESVAILRRLLPNGHPDLAQGLNNIGAVLGSQDKYAEAEPFLREGFDVLQKSFGSDHPRTARAHANLAKCYYNQGRYSDAEPMLKENLETHRRVLGEGHATTTWAYMNLISDLWAQGKFEDVEKLGTAAIASFETARPRFGATGLGRTNRMLEYSPMLLDLATAAAHQNHAVAAWQYLESRLARGLIDDLSVRLLSDEERETERTMIAQIVQLDQQIAVLMRSQPLTDANRSEAEKLRLDRDVVQKQLASFHAELSGKHGLVGGSTYDLKRIQKCLQPDAALITWIDISGKPKFQDGGGAHWVCVVRHQGDPVWVRLTGTGPDGAWQTDDKMLPNKVREILADRSNTTQSAWKEIVHRLYAQRLAPIDAQLSQHNRLPAVRNLIVLPSNEMAGIPIEALTDRFSVSYAPSATTFAWLQEQREKHTNISRGNSLLALGNPKFQHTGDSDAKTVQVAANQRVASFAELPATRIELHAISRVFSHVELLTQSEASEQNLERLAATGELGKFRYLHFATHGLLDDQRALNSALVLAQDRIPDPLAEVLAGKEPSAGRLTAAEILRSWKLDADLVTMSACETALGKFSGGEGYLGFSQALFLAGARGMVLSLWRVDDRAAALLMTRFYENMLGTPDGAVTKLSKVEALAEAKRWLRNLSANEVERLTADLPKGLPVGTRGVRRERQESATVTDGPRPFEHPYYWSAFILIGDPR